MSAALIPNYRSRSPVQRPICLETLIGKLLWTDSSRPQAQSKGAPIFGDRRECSASGVAIGGARTGELGNLFRWLTARKGHGARCLHTRFRTPEMAHAAVVRSPWPHAKILMDISMALKAPGVQAIVSGFHDVERHFSTTAPLLPTVFRWRATAFALWAKIVAAVAADTLAQAKAAAKLIEVRYRPCLPP